MDPRPTIAQAITRPYYKWSPMQQQPPWHDDVFLHPHFFFRHRFKALHYRCHFYFLSNKILQNHFERDRYAAAVLPRTALSAMTANYSTSAG